MQQAHGLQSLKNLLSGPFTENNCQLLVYQYHLVSRKETDVTIKRAFNEETCISFLLTLDKLSQT